MQSGPLSALRLSSCAFSAQNIQFRDKTVILRTLVDVAPNFSQDEKTNFKKTLCNIGEYSKKRNMIAHNPFLPDQSQKGVEFRTVKAKGTFSLPKVVWLDAEFQRENQTIAGYQKLLEELQAKCQVRPLDLASYAAAFQHDDSWHAAWIHANRQRMMQAATHPLNHQVLGPPDSQSRKKHSIPDKPQE